MKTIHDLFKPRGHALKLILTFTELLTNKSLIVGRTESNDVLSMDSLHVGHYGCFVQNSIVDLEFFGR